MAAAVYDSKKFVFEVRDDGTVGAFRPRQILVRHGGSEAVLQNAYDALGLTPRVPQSPIVDDGEFGNLFVPDLTVDLNWGVIVLPDPGSERTAVSELMGAGIEAQLNNVYFIGTLDGSGRRNYAAPNYAVPNYAVPNYAVPNYAVPNYAVPNYAVPNYAVPNYAVPNYAVGGDGFAHRGRGEACDDCEPLLPPEVPANTARGARVPLQQLPPADFAGAKFEIHVLDVRPVIGLWTDDEEVFLEDKPTEDLINRPGALLPEALDFGDAKVVRPQTPDDRTPTLEDLKKLYAEEPFSPGRGANVNGSGYSDAASSVDERLDPATNHGDFIKGIIDQVVRKAVDDADAESLVTSWSVAGSLGDVSDSELVRAMTHVNSHSDPGATRIMSLSIAGYPDVEEIREISEKGMDCLEEKVVELQGQDEPWKIVASVGNDASCRPTRPASIEGVIAVGAYGAAGPAWFSNYGDWVDACAPGVGIISNFPTGDPDALAALELNDITDVGDEFIHQYASWSGTSFAAPFAAAILTRYAVENSVSFDAAAAQLITHEDALTFPGYGTILSYREERMRIETDRPWV